MQKRVGIQLRRRSTAQPSAAATAQLTRPGLSSHPELPELLVHPCKQLQARSDTAVAHTRSASLAEWLWLRAGKLWSWQTGR